MLAATIQMREFSQKLGSIVARERLVEMGIGIQRDAREGGDRPRPIETSSI